ALAGLAAPRRPERTRWGKGSPVPGRAQGSRKVCRFRDLGAIQALRRGPAGGPLAPGGAGRRGSARAGGETLAAPAFGAGVGVAEYEPLAQALAGEVDFGAVHQRQAGGIDEDADAVLLEHRVAVAPVAGQVGHVAPAGTAGALHARSQAPGLRVALQEALHAL